MGGNIFPECERVNLETYKQLCKTIEDRFRHNFGYGELYFPKNYSDKESYGDIDVLVEGLNNLEIKELPQIITGTKSYFENESKDLQNIQVSGVIMTRSETPVQVDFIKVNRNTADFSYRYFSFNDLGNLMGVIADRMGFSFGHDGLWYKFLDKHGQTYKKILITDKFVEAMEILGYDYPSNTDFPNLESIFSFVSSNALFDPRWYKLENRNSKNRTRDRKRFTYMAFLEWLDEKGQEFFNPESFDTSEILKKTLEKYPRFLSAYTVTKARMEEGELFRSRWNGDVVKNITGMPYGLGLGLFMNYCQKSIGDFPAFILTSSEENITKHIQEMQSHVKLMAGI